jgi:hypothetical protein
MATKIITGRETLTYYHHQIALAAAAAAFLKVLHQPLLPYLDILILGIGMFLVFGRVGCLMAGCCYGRPCRVGIRYGEAHARHGFASYLTGVPLAPVQAAESFAVLLIVSVGSLIFSNRQSGAALAWYTIAYGATRFGLEFLRGDSERPYWLGYSECQWISLLLMTAVVWAERAGMLPHSAWHAGCWLVLLTATLALALYRRVDGCARFQLLHPRHVDEVAQAMRNSLKDDRPRVRCTSAGIRISGGNIDRSNPRLLHYAVSAANQRLTRVKATALAELMEQLLPEAEPANLLEGRHGVFHVLFPRAGVQGASAR